MFCVGVLDDGKMTTIVKHRHTPYTQLPHNLDDEQTYSPTLVIIIKVISCYLCKDVVTRPMFALVTIMVLWSYDLDLITYVLYYSHDIQCIGI